MSLEGITEESIARFTNDLLSKLSELGGSAGNTTLRRNLEWEDRIYWPIRDRLVDQGRLELGKGKGGSVRLVRPSEQDVETTAAESQPLSQDQPRPYPIADAPGVTKEDALYEPIASVLRDAWAKDKRYKEFLVETTARQGSRFTKGKWTRPDLVVASMTTLLYVPGKLFDVTTFEVKPLDRIEVTAVYEALAHRRASTRSYVWMHIPDESREAVNDSLSAVVTEAKRYGIGVIIGSKPEDYDSWEEMVEALRVEPDPQILNEFIAVQFSAGNKEELLGWLR